MQIFDVVAPFAAPMLTALMVAVVAAWLLALVLTWLPTFRGLVFRTGLFGPGRCHASQLTRYDRVCRACAYPIGDQSRCPECGSNTCGSGTIRRAELRTHALRRPRAWLRFATIIAVLGSLSLFGGREAMELGNRLQWGSERPEVFAVRLVYAPVLDWSFARTVELPIGPDYRVYFQSRFISDWDFAVSEHDTRPTIGEVLCWIAPPPVMPQPSEAEVRNLTSLAGVQPEQFAAMARTESSTPHQELSDYPEGAVAVRIEVDSLAWSTIGDGHPDKTGLGASSALEALYAHYGLLHAWAGSDAELAAMTEHLDYHARGGNLRAFTGRATPNGDVGVTCINYSKSWSRIPLHRQLAGLVLFGLVQVVVIALIIGYVKWRFAIR